MQLNYLEVLSGRVGLDQLFSVNNSNTPKFSVIHCNPQDYNTLHYPELKYKWNAQYKLMPLCHNNFNIQDQKVKLMTTTQK